MATHPRHFPAGLALILVALASLAVGAVPAVAQDALRVAYENPKSDETHFLITGTVTNEGRREALDVSVTAQALDSKKKVVASGIVFVAPSIPPGRSAPFVAKVPKLPAASGFRVAVSSARFGFGGAGGESP